MRLRGEGARVRIVLGMHSEFVDVDGAKSISGGVAVVVDVMRAYTVAAWALAAGATDIVLVDEIDEAVTIAARTPRALLFKDGAPDERFDLHNSPRQLLDLDVTGRRIVQRTTAGTRGAVAASHADVLFCASFVCATSTALGLRGLNPSEVTFIVSGGLDAEEDLACAEFIAASARGETPDAEPFLQRASQSAAADDLNRGVDLGYTGVTQQDVPMCLEIDRFDFAMRVQREHGLLVLSSCSPSS